METKTLWVNYVERWKGCIKCPLHTTRDRTVIGRHSEVRLWDEPTPVDILFIGEAPGNEEDASGFPFDGPSGRFLMGIIAQTIPFSYYVTNLVACCPRPPEWSFGSTDIRQPNKKEMAACAPRLQELVGFVHPKGIVTLGAVAKSNIPEFGVDVCNLDHPAHIIRMKRDNPKAYNKKIVDFRIDLADFVSYVKSV